MTVFLNSFIPFGINKQGRVAASTYNLPLYIDGSCRREPDFQNPYPAITQLCRPKKLVTRLNKGDLVIYITKLGRYGSQIPHWKFIGVLEVINVQPNHISALAFYTNNNLPVSQNIMCQLTTPFPLGMTHGKCGFSHNGLTPARIISKWNTGYQIRANDYPQVAITQIWNTHIYINNPPVINHQMMKAIFGRIPGTQNPPSLSQAEWSNFRNVMNI